MPKRFGNWFGPVAITTIVATAAVATARIDANVLTSGVYASLVIALGVFWLAVFAFVVREVVTLKATSDPGDHYTALGRKLRSDPAFRSLIAVASVGIAFVLAHIFGVLFWVEGFPLWP